MNKKLQKVISVTTSVTTIVWLSGIAALAPMSAMAATINEGDTIKTADNPDVYIAKYVGSKKFKRLILSPSVFNSYGHLSWSNIKTVTQAELDAFTTSELVRAVGDPKVYQLTPEPNSDNGQKQWINMTAEAFTAGGWDWDSIYEINGVDRDSYDQAATEIVGGTPSNPTTAGASGAAGTLTVSLASDTPAAGVAVGGAARVPFTKVTFTTGSAAATITGLTVQRTGLADDAALASIALIDASDNTQIGLNQTLNAAHQATFMESITIPANTSKSYILAANMPPLVSLVNFAGQIASLSLVGVNSAGTVSGSLPITGNGQTINGTLAIGTATITAGAYDPQTAVSNKEVGTTNYNFSSVKVTAGTTEDITVYSIRFNQSGSAAATDLANIKVSDGTTDYATTVSADGKYYTANFGSTGVVIAKGLNKDFTIKGDILNGSSRTISFDIYRNTDIVVKGNLYGYHMTPTFTENGVENTSNNTFIQANASPYFGGANVTIGGGSLRVDKNTTLAPAANITEGATGQILGAFDFVVLGEQVNLTSIRLDFDHTGVGSSSDITMVTLVKEDGTVLATGGTVADDRDLHGTTLDGTVDGHVAFSGTISFPVGTTKVLVKGNLNTDFAANNTFRVGFATTGVGTNITNITGATTGNTITATPSGSVWGNAMTVKSGALTVTVAGTPVAQQVIKGAQDFTFANLLFDATASGEDIRITQIILYNSYSAIGDVQSMKLYDGTTLLNSTAVTPVAGDGSPDPQTFTLSTPLVITKGAQKTITVKGNVWSSATNGNTQQWGLRTSTSDITATGVSTGQGIAVSTTESPGPIMTIAGAGQYSVALDASTPSARLLAANTTGNTMTTLRFRATSEQINISKIRLELSNASSSTNDISQVYLYDGSTLLAQGALGTGNAEGGSGVNARTTFTLNTPLQIPANGEKVVIIKADIAPITTDATIATAGHSIAIDYYGGATSLEENLGIGAASGEQIANYSPSTTQPAAYIYRSVPTVSVAVSSNSFTTGGTKTLSRFSVKADAAGDLDLYKFTFAISTSSNVALSNLTLVDVTDAEVTLYAGVSSYYADLGPSEIVLLASPGTIAGGVSTPRTVSANMTRTFELRASVSYSGSGSSFGVDAYLAGDIAETAKADGVYGLSAANADNDSNDDFIWSDRSAASHSKDTTDWYNGYLVNGLPAGY